RPRRPPRPRRAARQHRAEPRRDFPELLQRAKAQSADLVTSFFLGLRLGRWGIVGFSLAAAFATFVQTVAFYQIAGHSPAERAAFGSSILALGSQLVALFPPPVRPDTVGGYVEFRGFHPLAILFAIWALAGATGFARGDEERGIVESTLAAGVSRGALIAARAGAFAVGLAVAATAAAAGFLTGLAYGHESVPARAVFEESALLVAIGLSC